MLWLETKNDFCVEQRNLDIFEVIIVHKLIQTMISSL